MLLNEQDWLQVHAALQALHWLQYRPALDDIEHVATSHWYALVRDFAAVTAQRLRADQSPLEKTLSIIIHTAPAIVVPINLPSWQNPSR